MLMLAKLYYATAIFYIPLKRYAFVLLGLQAGLMAKLTDLGFSKGAIVETIVSTYGSDGKPNAAPVGMIMQDEQHLTVDLFNSSQTCRNIKANRYAVINLTGDIEFFYRSAFKEANPNGKLPAEWFQRAQLVNAPTLSLAEASIEVSVERLELTGARGIMKTRAILKVESITATSKYPQAFSRAMSLTLEAIIHATRVKVLINDEKPQNRVAKLLEVISDCHQVVNRVAPNSSYSQIMDDLTQRIEGWRKPT